MKKNAGVGEEVVPNEDYMQPCKNFENRIMYRNFCYFSFLIFTFNTVKCQSNESTWRNRLHSNEKLYVLFKSPSLEYECFLERYCLKAIRNGDESTKKEILQKAQSTWKSEG